MERNGLDEEMENRRKGQRLIKLHRHCPYRISIQSKIGLYHLPPNCMSHCVCVMLYVSPIELLSDQSFLLKVTRNHMPGISLNHFIITIHRLRGIRRIVTNIHIHDVQQMMMCV